MKKIQMVDLKGQYQAIKKEVNASIQEVIDTAAFINGPKVKIFQKNLESYLGVKHVIPCANGTDALQIAMMGLGLKPGDEVITADFTFAATVEVIALLGLTPVLVDVDPEYFNIDIEAIRKIGLAKGGSLDNAVVVKDNEILNKDGLRNSREFVNHKILDCIGDLYTSGYRIIGNLKCSRGGHYLTNQLLREVFSSNENFSIIEIQERNLPHTLINRSLLRSIA